jgi:ATP-binding cassette, subfamily B, bacterial PglK
MKKIIYILKSANSSGPAMFGFFLSGMILALLELATVGAMPVFITTLLSPETTRKYLIEYLPWIEVTVDNHLSLILKVGCSLLIFLLLKSAVALSISLYQNKAMTRYQVGLSSMMLKKYLSWPYEQLQAKNSAELIRNTVSVPVTIVSSVLSGLMILVTEVLLIVFAGSLLIYTHPYITLGTLFVLAFSIAMFFLILKSKLGALGHQANIAAAKTMQWLNQSLGGIKEIRVANREGYFQDKYIGYFSEFSKSTLSAQYWSQVPRFFLEVIAVASMLGLAAALLVSGRQADLLPTIAMFGAVALRLIPSANRIWGAIANIRANISSMDIFVNDMLQTSSVEESYRSSLGRGVAHSLEVNSLSYAYPGSEQLALNNLNLVISSMTTIGIAGRSGAGKSTLLDVLLGLHRPSQGSVLVDGQDIWCNLLEWRASIGYVPQQIFILDDTLRRNIAMGEQDATIDDVKVLLALTKANLGSFLSELPEKLETKLGESGARLSGGQRQRIGIARALYRNPGVLFLDEPTSALDKDTEQSITETLQLLHKTITIIIIAHHVTMMELCDHIFYLEDGRMKFSGSIKELAQRGIVFK